jgi:thioredoxin-dependent peroxiredoxin
MPHRLATLDSAGLLTAMAGRYTGKRWQIRVQIGSPAPLAPGGGAFRLDALQGRGHSRGMQTKWIHCFAAVLCAGAAACQKDQAPAPPAAETVTQSSKPLTEAAKPVAPVTSAAATTSTNELKAGDDAPALTLTLQDGKTIPLASLKGQQVVVYFYPKDDTPGCTVEAQGIRDEWESFQKAGIQVFGVSMQDAASHSAFIEKHKLPFNLVVDPDQSVTKAFGVPVRDGQFAARHTFLIGADGKIKRVWREVQPKEHAKEVLDAAGVSSAPAAAPKAG